MPTPQLVDTNEAPIRTPPRRTKAPELRMMMEMVASYVEDVRGLEPNQALMFEFNREDHPGIVKTAPTLTHVKDRFRRMFRKATSEVGIDTSATGDFSVIYEVEWDRLPDGAVLSRGFKAYVTRRDPDDIVQK